jgi:hypothetical protein
LIGNPGEGAIVPSPDVFVPSKLVDVMREGLGIERSVLAGLHLDYSHAGEIAAPRSESVDVLQLVPPTLTSM